MRLLPAGDCALLVECADAAERRRADAALRALRLPTTDQVPAAVTVLLRFATPAACAAARARITAVDLTDVAPAPAPPLLTIPVRYDGADLEAVATHLGYTRAELIAWHTARNWTCDFVGFLPGFAYLRSDAAHPSVPRRDTPRTRIPPGAVALAGEYCGIYPTASPGGWQLIGSTETAVWDDARTPPGLIGPGQPVRFRAVPDA